MFGITLVAGKSLAFPGFCIAYRPAKMLQAQHRDLSIWFVHTLVWGNLSLSSLVFIWVGRVIWGVGYFPLVLKGWRVLSAPCQSTSSIEMLVLKLRCLQWIWHFWRSWLVFWQKLQFLLHFSNQRRIPCVSWWTFLVGFGLMGQVLLKKQHKAIAGQALMHILKYLPVLIAFAFSPSYFPHQSIKWWFFKGLICIWTWGGYLTPALVTCDCLKKLLSVGFSHLLSF